jgi:Tfp pilus tip-associated adhesin PilY1
MSLVVLGSVFLSGLQALAQPSNRPLLAGQTGAKPNLMVALDNSGSMAFPFHEAYALQFTDNNANALRICAGVRTFARTLFGDVLNGRVDFLQPTGNRCFQTNNPPNADGTPNFGGGAFWVADGPAIVPAVTASNNFNAARSADLNPVYYNPRTTYSPRLGPDYVALARPAGINFVSNAGNHFTTASFYRVWRNPADSALYTTNTQKPALPAPAWATAANNVYNLSIQWAFPTHVEHNATDGTTPTFQYAFCRDAAGNLTVQRDQEREIGCASVRNPPFGTSLAGSVTTVFAPGDARAAGNTIVLPPDHQRTDCGTAATTCTNEQERINILNWYHWYSTRQLATSTAIGQSLASPTFQNELRIGYLPINDYTLANVAGQGGNTNLAIVRNPAVFNAIPAVTRGVRTLQGGSAANTQLYTFLNNVQSRGGTPLHNAVTVVGQYYGVPNGAVENPWSTNPAALASAANPEMSCRRSFNLLFSDGGWTGPPVAPAAGPDFDNINGPTFSRLRADGTTETFQYLRIGDDTVAGRIQYIPFPSSGTGGIADISADYYWHRDLRTALDNNVQTRPGQPTFWQNMTTYTVGYLIRPTGEVTGTGLSFAEIDQYRTQYTLSGYAAATKPTWPTGSLLTSSTQTRVDDFIHAGYTGGGRSFSARTSDDVRNIFNTIVAEILSASGRDAGVSVSSGSGDNSTLAGRLKYTVSYRTLDNSGDILARELAADGSETGVTAWSANQLMPLPRDRRVFTMSGLNISTVFSGPFSGLPTDVRAALATGPLATRIPTDARFIDYLRGDNTVLDANNTLFRQRVSNIAAMVNPPSVFMGGARDFGYDLTGNGGVDGRGSYLNFTNRKRGFPASLFVATNAGTMHAFSAERGTELAAMMPRRSLTKQLTFATEPYNFEYVLDGPISEHDIFDRGLANTLSPENEWRAWRHLGVGTGGRGAKLVYAVNSPIKPGAPPAPGNTDLRRQPDQADFLWETGPDRIDIADGGDVTAGFMSNPVRSGQTEDLSDESSSQRGRWIVAVNNGHYNGEPNGEKSGLVVLDALTGEVIRTIPLPAGFSAGVGLSGVTLLRSFSGNTRVVAAYAGDANGQLWKFNLSGAPSSWGVEHNRPLFTVPGNRPIYGHPAWQEHEAGGFMVVFATGILLEDSHLADLGQQTIYGIWDRQNLDRTMLENETFSPVTQAQLEERTVLRASERTRIGFDFYAITGDAIDWNTQRGWFIEMNNVHETNNALRRGERSIANVQNFGKSVIITSTVVRPPPAGEMCTVADLPANYVYIVRAQDASPTLSRSFDVDGDGGLDAFDSNSDGRVDAGYAVAYAPQGGFARGTSVTSFRTRSDGTAIPLSPQQPPSDLSDPQVERPGSSNSGDPIRPPPVPEPDGESRDTPCETTRGIVTGTGSTTLPGGVFCPTTGWNRTQYQLSAPPSN